MRIVFGYINKLERTHLPTRFRKSVGYFWVKLLLLLPLVIAGFIETSIRKLWEFIKRGGRIKREDKPDIVLKNIASGFANLAFPDAKTEALAMKRAKICAECPMAEKTGVYSVVVDKRTKNIQGMKCGECGCNLSAKVRSVKDYCPLGYW